MGTQTATVPLLRAEPLTAEAFRPFGEVVAAPEGRGRTKDVRAQAGPNGRTCVRTLVADSGNELPLTVGRMERHPLGTQAFVPTKGGRFFVIVAPPGKFNPAQVRAFVTDGRQGINLFAGTWHHSFLAEQAGDSFLVVDREGPGNNIDFAILSVPIKVTG